MKSTEICLIGLKGKLKNIKKSNNVKSLLMADRTIHSKKPDEIRTRITQFCGDLPRIELFARQKAEGWDSWGNEV
jgi:site-specific DNA-methyltransferase (adenine-specific)